MLKKRNFDLKLIFFIENTVSFVFIQNLKNVSNSSWYDSFIIWLKITFHGVSFTSTSLSISKNTDTPPIHNRLNKILDLLENFDLSCILAQNLIKNKFFLTFMLSILWKQSKTLLRVDSYTLLYIFDGNHLLFFNQFRSNRSTLGLYFLICQNQLSLSQLIVFIYLKV